MGVRFPWRREEAQEALKLRVVPARFLQLPLTAAAQRTQRKTSVERELRPDSLAAERQPQQLAREARGHLRLAQLPPARHSFDELRRVGSTPSNAGDGPSHR